MQYQNLKALMVLMLGVLVLLAPIAQADTDTDAQAAMAAVQTVLSVVDALQRTVEILSEAKEPLFRALSFASGGLYSYSPPDGRRNAQAVINLLEGVDSEFYKPVVDVSLDFSIGIRPHMAELLTIDQDLAESRGRPLLEDYTSAWQTFLSMLRLASDAMLSVIDGDLDTQETSDAFLIARTFILQIYDNINDILRNWGYEIWVSPGESIQAAIDTANEGATIYIEPGAHRETLEITKSITLVGWMAELPQTAEGVHRGYGTALQPVGDQAGILIHSSEPIVVEIRRLSIEGASHGITVSGDVRLLLEDVDVIKGDVGIDISSTASVEMSNCYLEYNDIAVRATGTSESEIRDCKLRYCDNLLGALQILESSAVAVSRSFIRDNAGNGIFVSDQARLAVVDSYILSNGDDGVLLAGDCQVELANTSITANDGFGVRSLIDECALEELNHLKRFSGTISGASNFIASADTMMGNGRGRFCPDEYEFLTAPAPTEVLVEPGESIQAAIDAVAEGGTVTIEPGTYLEAITIDKSLNLVSAADDSADAGQSGEVILGWDVEGPVISVSAHAPVEVTLSGLVFQGESAGWGIDVGENSAVELQGIVFRDLGTAIQVHNGGLVVASYCDFTGNGSTVFASPKGSFTASWCTFTGNRQAISVSLGSVCTLTDSTIAGCTDASAAITAWCSDLTLENCIIRDNQGTGIKLGGGEASRLHMINSHLTGNAVGVEFVFGSCNPGDDPDWEAPTSLYDKSHGTVTGWNNHIPGADEPDGNWLGSFEYYYRDYLDPTFLTEPKPADE